MIGDEMYLEKNVRPNNNDLKMAQFQAKFEKSLNAYIPGTCPISQQLAMCQAAVSQSCGKCVPCRDGLKQAEKMLQDIVNLNATENTLKKLEKLALTIKDTADCAIGYDAANTILKGIQEFNIEYKLHANSKNCSSYNLDVPPCVSYCPANVDIPAYVSLISQNKYEDAIRVIRNDNPFVTACAYVCEHPCEAKCRRSIMDDSINIKGLKRYAVEKTPVNKVSKPNCGQDTGKKIAIIGGGPSGLTAAYYLGLMGHEVCVYEAKNKLGGMLRYGIPNYRLPKNRLDQDIKMILSCKNIEAKTGIEVGKDITLAKLNKQYDAIYVAIGAQIGKSIKLPGLNTKGVFSAVEMLDSIGNGNNPNFKGKKVVVVGGGNVAMDAARSALRCGAKETTIVYRRRREDMTALDSEVQSAIEEGVELMTLHAPHKITKNKNGSVSSLIARPQMISKYDRSGRPSPVAAKKPDVEIKCDVILLAIGQDIVSEKFKNFGVDDRRKTLLVNKNLATINNAKVFAGGDCVLGPATVIKAVANGKNAAINIDKYLGYNHQFKEEIKIPDAKPNNRELFGRANTVEVPAKIRKNNFNEVELCLSDEEAMQECNKCLRCDHFGCNTVEGA